MSVQSTNDNNHRITQLMSLLEQSPSDSFLKHAMALEYVKIGNDLGAQKLFEEVIINDENYIGSYYHLAKLYERLLNYQSAINTYQQGIIIAQKLQDRHSLSELRSALEQLQDELDG
jgi:Tfp pilus assembly protein PilF